MNRLRLGWSRFAIFLWCAHLLPAVMLGSTPGKTLIVVAHPDDEYYCAATVYRMAVQLGATVDELIITDGEGGFRYATLAEAYYKRPLTIESVGRKELPAIRKKEAINAGKVLGIRTHYFLNQKDEHFTTDEKDGLKYGWNPNYITSQIVALIRREHYQYIFSILPRSTTHGYHQAATAFGLTAIQALPEDARPVLFGFDTDPSALSTSITGQSPQQWENTYAYAFDRTTKCGFHNALTYQVIVDWMIAEHKSQGLLQTMDNKDPKEYIWVAYPGDPKARSASASLFHLLETGSEHR